MTHARNLDEVSPGIFVWQKYENSVKAELFSTALSTQTGTYVVDPITLDTNGLLQLGTSLKIAGICVTNCNHARAATEFATTFAVPIYVHNELRRNAEFPNATGLHDGELLAQGLTALTLEGGPAGEMALHCEENGGTMVLGDALINFEPSGFRLLPEKYCMNARLMRRSLRKLLDHPFDRIFFAHGTPILSKARARLEQLLLTC